MLDLRAERPLVRDATLARLLRQFGVISEADYSGFDHALFREVQRRAGRTNVRG